jgi:hypothetical protein
MYRRHGLTLSFKEVMREAALQAQEDGEDKKQKLDSDE